MPFSPRPNHGTIRFYRLPWSRPGSPPEVAPPIACGDPPHRVIGAGYTRIIGLAATPEEAAEMVAANLLPDPPR